MAGEQNEDLPAGWPGSIWLEGKTIIHMQNSQPRPSHMPRGPAKKLALDSLILQWLLPELGLYYY